MKLLSVIPLSFVFATMYITSENVIQLQVDDLCHHIAIELESAVHANILSSNEADELMERCTRLYRLNS